MPRPWPARHPRLLAPASAACPSPWEPGSFSWKAAPRSGTGSMSVPNLVARNGRCERPAGNPAFESIPVSKEIRDQFKYDEGTEQEWQDPNGAHWQLFYFRWQPARSLNKRVMVQRAKMHGPTTCLPLLGMKLTADSGEITVPLGDFKLALRQYQFESEGRPAACVLRHLRGPNRQRHPGQPETRHGQPRRRRAGRQPKLRAAISRNRRVGIRPSRRRPGCSRTRTESPHQNRKLSRLFHSHLRFPNFCFFEMRFLLLNQTFHPDVMATGQYLTEVALRLVERGHQVTVITSRQTIDQPETQFQAWEIWRGVHIYRVGSSGFGKRARWRRAADFASFTALCALRLAFLPAHDVVVALTSPPLISFLGALAAKLRGGPVPFIGSWISIRMKPSPRAGCARGRPWRKVLEAMSRFSLRQAKKIIGSGPLHARPHRRQKHFARESRRHSALVSRPGRALRSRGASAFPANARLDGKFVVMYSGNHSPCHPLDTLIAAARKLAGDRKIVFTFIGGGSEFRKIERQAQGAGRGAGGANLLCLPYQPLSDLALSLSAADLHVAVMGNAFVGLIHPCKIYNILSVGAPVLYLGPRPSHVSEILDHLGGEQLAHSDVEGVVQAIERVEKFHARQSADGDGVRLGVFAADFAAKIDRGVGGELINAPCYFLDK